MPAVPVLRVEGLTVRYGALVALERMTWEVEAGRILGIIGPNGAGKSSCFAAVTGSVAHGGEVYLDGRRVTGVPTWDLAALGLRRTFQQNAFFGELTVLENTMGAIISEHSTGLLTSIVAPWTTQRSATPFCQGDWKLVRLGFSLVASKKVMTSASNFASRSRIT